MKKSSRPPLRATRGSRPSRGGFTLIEVLVATAVFLVLLTLLLSITSHAGKIWQSSENQKSRREVARAALEMIARDFESTQFPLRSGSANSLEFARNPAAISATYKNRDALFWQAPLSGPSESGDLQEVGYFVQWIEVAGQPPRGELCRLRVPAANSDSIFNDPDNWLSDDKLKKYAPGSTDTNTYHGSLAENVLALWVTLYDTNNVPITASPYSSRSDPQVASAEIAIAVADPQTGRRVFSTADITSHYDEPTIDDFVSKLPPDIRQGVGVFKTRLYIESSR